jgi:hypothetical protein
MEGVTLDTRLMWLTYIYQFRKKAAKDPSTGPLLNRRNDLLIRNGSSRIWPHVCGGNEYQKLDNRDPLHKFLKTKPVSESNIVV